MVSLDLTFVNSVSINKLCSNHLIVNVPRVYCWDTDTIAMHFPPEEGTFQRTFEYIPQDFTPHLLIHNIYLTIMPL